MKATFYHVELWDQGEPEERAGYLFRSVRAALKFWRENRSADATIRETVRRVVVEGRSVVEIAMGAAYFCGMGMQNFEGEAEIAYTDMTPDDIEQLTPES